MLFFCQDMFVSAISQSNMIVIQIGKTCLAQSSVKSMLSPSLKFKFVPCGDHCSSVTRNTYVKMLRKCSPVRTENIFKHSLLWIYRTIILPVVLCGCETWSLTMSEESRLRMFENRVLRRILGPKRDEVTGEWRKLHNEKLNDLYCSPNIFWVIKSRRIRLAGHVACMGRGEVYTGFWWGDMKERDH